MDGFISPEFSTGHAAIELICSRRATWPKLEKFADGMACCESTTAVKLENRLIVCVAYSSPANKRLSPAVRVRHERTTFSPTASASHWTAAHCDSGDRGCLSDLASVTFRHGVRP